MMDEHDDNMLFKLQESYDKYLELARNEEDDCMNFDQFEAYCLKQYIEEQESMAELEVDHA